jgi:chromosome segregation ATPase
MDKFDNAADAGRSMLTGETVKEVTKTSVISPDKSSRSLWAVSMCSLVAVASLSCVLVADRSRIAQLEAELAATHENRHLIDSLNRPEVMQRVLSLAQTSSSSFSSTSTKSASASIDVTKTTTTTQQGTLSEQQDHEIIDAFSTALHDELARLDSRIMTINASWSTSQTDLTQLQSDVNELEVSTTDIKIDVTTLENNYVDLDVTVTGLQGQVDTLNGIIDGGSDDAKALIARLTDLEDDAVVIRGDVDTIQVNTVSIEN